MKKLLACVLALLLASVPLLSLAAEPASPAAARDGVTLYGICLHELRDGFEGCWVSLDASDPAGSVQNLGAAPSSYAAAYMDGTVYGLTRDGGFFSLPFPDFESVTVIPGAYDNTTYIPTSMTSLDGALYAVAAAGQTSTLVSVDASTGALTTIGTMYPHLLGIAGADDGFIYGISDTGGLYAVDPATADMTMIGSTDVWSYFVQDLCFDPVTGLLYWAQLLDGGTHGLYSIDPANAHAEYLGRIGPGGMELVGLFAAPEPAGLLGDANGDGRVDVSDALLILRWTMGLIGDDALDLSVSDFDGSGTVNTSDALMVLRRAMGLI